MQADGASPEQDQPLSTPQPDEHPSPLTVPLSSQPSDANFHPSPQVVAQLDGNEQILQLTAGQLHQIVP